MVEQFPLKELVRGSNPFRLTDANIVTAASVL